MEIRFEPATLNDVEEMIQVQNLAFEAEYQRKGFCTSYGHSPESMAGLILTSQGYLIRDGDAAVGNLLYRQSGEEDYWLSCISVIPEYQGRGIGGLAMAFLEELHPKARRWALETPADSERNLHFYKKHGFSLAKQYEEGGVTVALLDRHR